MNEMLVQQYIMVNSELQKKILYILKLITNFLKSIFSIGKFLT